MTVALIVGSFDPLIQGQADLIARTTAIAERVIVAVEATPHHKSLYTFDERVARAKACLAGLPTVEVRPYDGDLAKMVAVSGATVYVVALRGGNEVATIVAELQPMCNALGLELMALLAEPTHAFVTTALVRDVARLGGNIAPFLP